MKQSFFYEAYLIDQKCIEQHLTDDHNNYQDGYQEDDYESTHILFQHMIGKIQDSSLIVEIWQIKP
ncbi:hypothetical protein RhiirA4_472884 [Rhizophagus irregularis]|uniref:Uncharacterized protein n=1 Tax=Rhizophagus irregularis TaxID=588596 RepID=A0A2I1H5P9_9GLOM|nr:hypothetical protein RhiirA4_472884 [Rhizophagus irregularis]